MTRRLIIAILAILVTQDAAAFDDYLPVPKARTWDDHYPLGGVVCGDGVVEGLEGCDDGNIATSDGCDASCAVESYWTCTGSPSICTEVAYFAASLGTSGLSQLSKTLTINGVTVEPSIWCEGQDATATAWACDYGGTFSIAGSGAEPTVGAPAPFTDGTTAIRMNGGKYYSATGFPAIGTNDWIIIMANSLPITNSHYFASGSYVARIRTTSGTALLNINDGGGEIAAGSCAFTTDSNNIFVHFGDRSGSGVCYTNAVKGTAVSISSRQGSLGTSSFNLLGHSSFNMPYGDTSLFAIYTCGGCLSAHDADTDGDGVGDQQALARQITQQLAGIYPQIADTYPATFTRAGIATMEQYNAATSTTTLHTVGSGWPRVESWVDSGGTRRTGYRGEPSAQNTLIQSQALDLWAAPTRASVSANSVMAPDGTFTADVLTEDGTAAATHLVSTTATTTSGSVYTLSAYVKIASGARWLSTRLDQSTDAIGYFDITSCAAGTGTDATLYVASIRDGWCRVEMKFTADITSSRNVFFNLAEADNDNVFSGNSTSGLAIWQAQLELTPATGRASSGILTTTAAVTRPADVLYYTVPAFAGGTVAAKYLQRNPDVGTDMGLLSLSTGAAAEQATLFNEATGDIFTAEMHSSSTPSVQIVDATTDIADGAEHALRAYFSTTNNRLFVAGSQEGSTDTSGTLPASAVRLYIGNATGAAQSGALLSDVELFYQLTQTSGY